MQTVTLREKEESSMPTESQIDKTELLALTTEIVSSHVANNAVAASDLPDLIHTIYAKLHDLANDEVEKKEELVPAVPVKKSVTDDYIICLEDGKKLKMLKRHLATAYNMTPDEYRAKWGLKADYPMVAPSYSRKRQALAKENELGRKPSRARK
jgi:predicted transcriptional regulator